MKFDENLRELRKEKGYSQEELAYKLEVTRQTVSKWENGSAMPDLKKLTELAEFFGVSMDDLLGLEVEGESKAGNENSNFEAYVQYTDQRIAALEESRNKETKKKITILICLFTVAILLLFVWFNSYLSEIQIKLNTLGNQYVYLYNEINRIGSSGGSDNYWESRSDDVTASLLSADPEKPYIVQMQLKYSPMSYAKGSKVYFSVPKEDKSIEKLEAEEINGEFILTTDIDLTVEGEYYFILDDGNEIVKEELYIYPEDLYCSIENHINYAVSRINTFDKKYYFENYNEDNKLFWSSIASDKLVSAQLIVESGGKEIFNQELELIQSDSLKGTFITLLNYTVEISNFENLRAYVLATDDLGVVYKHYIDLESVDIGPMESTYYFGEYDVIIFDVEGKGKVKVGEAEALMEEKVSQLEY